MADPMTLDGPRQEPEGQPARRLVVFLHGLGANGADLIALAPYMAPHLPETAFVAPDAPLPCDMAPMGLQWFSMQRRDRESLHFGAEDARGALDAFLDEEMTRYGLSEADVALIGFSQGTMMALQTALRRERPVAAVVGYSGMLIDPDRLEAEIESRPPVLLIHGDADEVVPFEAMEAARVALASVDVDVQTFSRPDLGHSIDAEGLKAAILFLREKFGLDAQA